MMTRRLIRLVAAALLGTTTMASAQAAPKRPNFLVIVADDLGFSDLGAFGGEIATPNLDALAMAGVRLTGFHAAPTCSPTRSMLMTGTDNHRAGLGSMAELLAPNQAGKPGHEGYLRAATATLPEQLGAAGYRTLMAGKWHLGTTPETDPSRRGFQTSFTMLQGAHNHFGDDVGTGDKPGGATYRENGRTLTTLPKGFYSSDGFAGALVAQLQAGAAGPDRDKPFFAYLAFSAPHWPLQAPAETIAKYKGRYDAGYEVLRRERLTRQARLGLVDPARPVHELSWPHGDGRWAALSAAERRAAARRMEVYAAMVDRLDTGVGRVVAQLKASGEYDNTVILFMADNGAEGLDLATTGLEQIKVRAAGADNRLENFGARTSYLTYGPGWAQAASAPSWLYKAYTTEGGTRVPAFIVAPAAAGLKPGSVAPTFGTVMDVLPTVLDLAGVPDAGGRFAGRAVETVRGKSWAPWLSGRADRVYAENEAIGSELFGSRALRRGDWKLVHLGTGNWRLFNLALDPGETRDLAPSQPARRTEMVALWEQYASDVGVILPDVAMYRP